MARFADTALACGCVHPGEEGQDGAGRTGLVAKVKVIGQGIVEVDGLLDKTQPEVARIKPQVLDWITADCGHMMDAWHGCLLMPTPGVISETLSDFRELADNGAVGEGSTLGVL